MELRMQGEGCAMTFLCKEALLVELLREAEKVE